MFNKKVLSQVTAALGKVKLPPKKKDIIVDPRGQWKHPGEVTRIPSADITMSGVPYPVLGVPNVGEPQMMYPDQDYNFQGAEYVDEYPMARHGGNHVARIADPYAKYLQTGGSRQPIFTSDPKDPRLLAYQDSLNLYKTALDEINIYGGIGLDNQHKLSKNEKTKHLQDVKNAIKNIKNPGSALSSIYTSSDVAKVKGNNIIFKYTDPKTGKDYWRESGYNSKIAPDRYVKPVKHADWFPYYKKPVQPVIYQKSNPKLDILELPVRSLSIPEAPLNRVPDNFPEYKFDKSTKIVPPQQKEEWKTLPGTGTSYRIERPVDPRFSPKYNLSTGSYQEGGLTKAQTGKIVRCPEGYTYDQKTKRCLSNYETSEYVYPEGTNLTDIHEKYNVWPTEYGREFVHINKPTYIKPIEQRELNYTPGNGSQTIDIYPDINYKIAVDPSRQEGYDKASNTYYVPSQDTHQYRKYREWEKAKELEKQNLQTADELIKTGKFHYDVYPDQTESLIKKAGNYNDPNYLPAGLKPYAEQYKDSVQQRYNNYLKTNCPECSYGHGESVYYDNDFVYRKENPTLGGYESTDKTIKPYLKRNRQSIDPTFEDIQKPELNYRPHKEYNQFTQTFEEMSPDQKRMLDKEAYILQNQGMKLSKENMPLFEPQKLDVITRTPIQQRANTNASAIVSTQKYGGLTKAQKGKSQDYNKYNQDVRYEEIYAPFVDRLNDSDLLLNNWEKYPTYNTSWLEYVLSGANEDRNIPPATPEIKEIQQKLLALPDTELHKLLSTNWAGAGIASALYHKPANVSYPDMYKYYNHLKYLKNKGYTLQEGGPYNTAGPVNETIFDPTDYNYLPTEPEKAWMMNKIVQNAGRGNIAARRMMDPNAKSYSFTGNEQIFGQPVGTPAGEKGSHFSTSMDNYFVPFIQEGQTGNLYFNENASPADREAIQFSTPQEAEFFANHYKKANPPMMRNWKQQGGPYTTQLTPTEEIKFQKFFQTLPDNLMDDDPSYDIRGYWDSEGRPAAFNYNQPKESDGFYHGYSINSNTGKYLKAPWHPTFQHAVEEDRKIGYRPIVNVKGEVIATENPALTEDYIEADLTPEEIQAYKDGGYVVEDISIPSLNYQDGGDTDATPKTVKNLKEVTVTEKPQWKKDRDKFGKDYISWYESIFSPKQWGLNDYSDYSSFNSAFRNARESGEKEFVYKGDRYNTNLIPKKDSDLYWESKDFLKNYYKTQPYSKNIIPDSSNVSYSHANEYVKNKLGHTWMELYEQQDKIFDKLGADALDDPTWNNIQKKMDEALKLEESLKTDPAYKEWYAKTFAKSERNKRLKELNNPTYFSITSQKPSDMSEDGYWNPSKNKMFMLTNATPGTLNTTYVHELSHKGDETMDVYNSVPPINLKAFNNSPFSSHFDQEGFNYVSDPTEIEARKLSTLFYLNKKKRPWEAGKITEESLKQLYDDYYADKLPYDIGQLLMLYGSQQDDLLKYLNSDYNYNYKKKQKGGVPTRADSLSLYNNALEQQSYYNRFKPYYESIKIEPWYSDTWDPMMKSIEQDHLNFGSIGWTKSEKQKFNKSIQKIKSDTDPNKYHILDLITGALDPNAPIAEYNTKVKPQGQISYNPKRYYENPTGPFYKELPFYKNAPAGEKKILDAIGKHPYYADNLYHYGYNKFEPTPLYNDPKLKKENILKWAKSKGFSEKDMNSILFKIIKSEEASRKLKGYATTLPYYNPLAVKPADMLTDAEVKERVAKYGPSGIPKSRLEKLGIKPSQTKPKVTTSNKPKTSTTTSKPKEELPKLATRPLPKPDVAPAEIIPQDFSYTPTRKSGVVVPPASKKQWVQDPRTGTWREVERAQDPRMSPTYNPATGGWEYALGGFQTDLDKHRKLLRDWLYARDLGLDQ